MRRPTNLATPLCACSAKFILFMLFATQAILPRALQADQIQHKDGRLLDGKFGRMSKTAEDPLKNLDAETAQPIFLCDDNLRRTMVPFQMLKFDSLVAQAESNQRIVLQQEVSAGKSRVACAGPLLAVQPFDPFGRRIIKIGTNQGPLDVIQGVTLITPHWTRIEGLNAGPNLVWDMRVATSSIPREQLVAMVNKNIKNPKDIEQRLQLVRLFIGSDRFRDAETELTAIAQDFPNHPQLEEAFAIIRKAGAGVLVRELDLRKNAGQHQLTWALLNKFPEQGVPGSIMQKVREDVADYQQKSKDREQIVKELKDLAAGLPYSDDATLFKTAVDEIASDLSLENYGRLAAYLNFRNDANTPPANKLALAVSGWLLTSNRALTNPKSALSLFKTRNLIREYLLSKTTVEREQIYKYISEEEANTPELIASLIKGMKPAWPLPELAANTDTYTIKVPGQPNQADYTYDLIPPLEYDPYRSYPAIVCLHAQGMTPSSEMDWWAGPPSENGRLGQAARQGYFVIAPHYVSAAQPTYRGTPLEHDVVTRCLRDACRRFNIDTDRVFLSGHSMGGDAAWDIGLSHPDLWAGVIPINGTAQHDPIFFYKQNAATVPFYFVTGELDCGVISKNSVNWDWYFSHNYDTTLVQYLGRGHEHFSDEILRLFDWMNRKDRAANGRLNPKLFKVFTKRATDNYFWSLEVREFKLPKLESGVQIEQTLNNNSIILRTPNASISVYLTPEMIDFSKPVNVLHNGKNLTGGKQISPNLRTILEDVRTRGDRHHPFWAVVESP
jgi:dienelactone hydrolase